MVSHELRTPLTAIVGDSRLLLRQAHGTLTPKQLETRGDLPRRPTLNDSSTSVDVSGRGGTNRADARALDRVTSSSRWDG